MACIDCVGPRNEDYSESSPTLNIFKYSAMDLWLWTILTVEYLYVLLDRMFQSYFYEQCPQTKFPTSPPAIEPFIMWSDCVYVI